jgi:CHAD domain-containing protein
MAYRLESDESFPSGIQRMVLEQVDKAIDNLKPTVKNQDEGIHDARVNIKKVRAVLRLIRHSMGDEKYKEADVAYRDVGRSLSSVRDSVAMLEVVDKLIEHFADQLPTNAFADLRETLQQSHERGHDDRTRAMTEASNALRELRERVPQWPEAEADDSISHGLKHVFKKGRASFDAARDEPSVGTFHEWRKHVKHLLHLMHVLRPIWGNMMKALQAELKTLGEYLSEDHDLAILREKVVEQLAQADSDTDATALIALIDQRRTELEAKASVLGSRIYAEKAGAFTSRVQTYWQAWRSQVRHELIVSQ